MIEVVGAHRVRVQVDAAEVDDPGELRRVVDDDLVGGPARREASASTVSIHSGRVSGARFWKNGSPLGAVDVALEHDRPAAGAAQRALGDRQVVADEVELGVPALREEDLVRVRDRDLAPVDPEDLLLRRHG